MELSWNLGALLIITTVKTRRGHNFLPVQLTETPNVHFIYFIITSRKIHRITRHQCISIHELIEIWQTRRIPNPQLVEHADKFLIRLSHWFTQNIPFKTTCFPAVRLKGKHPSIHRPRTVLLNQHVPLVARQHRRKLKEISEDHQPQIWLSENGALRIGTLDRTGNGLHHIAANHAHLVNDNHIGVTDRFRNGIEA